MTARLMSLDQQDAVDQCVSRIFDLVDIVASSLTELDKVSSLIDRASHLGLGPITGGDEGELCNIARELSFIKIDGTPNTPTTNEELGHSHDLAFEGGPHA